MKTETETDLGFIFRQKFGKDPRKMSLQQINRTVFGNLEPTSKEIPTWPLRTVDHGDPNERIDQMLAKNENTTWFKRIMFWFGRWCYRLLGKCPWPMYLMVFFVLSLLDLSCAIRYVKMPEPNLVGHSVRYYPRSGKIEIWNGAAKMGVGDWFEYRLPSYNTIHLTPDQERALKEWIENNIN